MTPFEPAELPPEAFDVDHIMRTFNCGRGEAEYHVRRATKERVFMNDLYQVNIDDEPDTISHDWPQMLHLSIKRRDKEPIHDWRHLQQIKNELVGPDHEAVELYPAEDRLVDTVNQYHLWVLVKPGMFFPFGWRSRTVGNSEAAARTGAKQRDRT
jgi:hypothetical protein